MIELESNSSTRKVRPRGLVAQCARKRARAPRQGCFLLLRRLPLRFAINFAQNEKKVKLNKKSIAESKTVRFAILNRKKKEKKNENLQFLFAVVSSEKRKKIALRQQFRVV